MSERILFISLEFASSTVFSGNGVLGRSYAFELARVGHHVEVICGAPISGAPAQLLSVPGMEALDDPLKEVRLHLIPVPESKWRRLDRTGPWAEFALGVAASCSSDASPLSASYDRCFYVDWSGWGAYAELPAALKKAIPSTTYLNFRVFANPALLKAPGSPTMQQQVDGESDWDFYALKETMAMLDAQRAIALCPTDCQWLLENFDAEKKKLSSVRASVARPDVSFLLPCLRKEILMLAEKASAEMMATTEVPQEGSNSKKYFTCCVRLAPEKNAMLFVNIVEKLSPLLRSLDVIPFLCGAAADEDYAAKVKQRLKEVHPESIIVDHFMDPMELAQWLEHTILNFHPSIYDAYGMTIIEAAAFGVPTVVHATPVQPTPRDDEGHRNFTLQSTVGACELLRLNPIVEPEIIGKDLVGRDVDDIADTIKDLITSVCEGSENAEATFIGRRAQKKALSWTEAAAVDELLRRTKIIT